VGSLVGARGLPPRLRERVVLAERLRRAARGLYDLARGR